MALKAKLTLDSKIFKPSEREEFERAVKASAELLLKRIKQYIIESKPTGRTYRIRMPSGRIKIHQASAKGEPPAILTRNLLNSIKLVKVGRYTWRIRVDAYYGAILDAEDYDLQRFFFVVKLEEHERENAEILDRAIKILVEDN